MKYLSIIVPVYNVEPYIERCLKSLEDQDIPEDDYEIICVNDGSTDYSRDVIIKIQKKFKNIILIDQENRGVSAARNRAIDASQGEYLLMVDPDDYLKTNILRERVYILKRFNPDVAYTGHIILNAEQHEIYRFDPMIKAGRIMTGIEYINVYMRNRSEKLSPHSSVGIFFRAAFFNSYNLRYLEGIPFLEDGEFLARINCMAEKVIYIKGTIYFIISRPGSATNSNLYYSEKAREGFLKAANNLLRFRQECCITESQKIFMNQPIVQFTIVYLISHAGIAYFKYYSKLYDVLKKGPLRVVKTEGSSDFYRKMGNAYNCSIHCFYLRWFLYKGHKSITYRIKRFVNRV